MKKIKKIKKIKNDFAKKYCLDKRNYLIYKKNIKYKNKDNKFITKEE